MLEEAVNVIRQLWTGEEITHRGDHYTVQGARLYTVPEQQAEIYLAASKPQRGRRGVRGSGRERKPKLGMIHIAYDEDEEAGHERAQAVAEPRARGLGRPGAAGSAQLRGVGRERHRRRRRRVDACRPGSGAVPRADSQVRRGRLHARLHPPDRGQPVGVRRVRGARAHAPAVT